jgi:hypothetical protein
MLETSSAMIKRSRLGMALVEIKVGFVMLGFRKVGMVLIIRVYLNKN